MKKAATPDGSSKWVGDEEFIEDKTGKEIQDYEKKSRYAGDFRWKIIWIK